MDRKKEVIEKLKKLRSKDPSFADGKIVSSVSTEPLDVALEAYRIFSDVNALDTYIFPTIQRIETEVVEYLGSLMKNPRAQGYVTSGGTEANIMALYAAKKLYPQRNEIIVPESAHYSIHKAADLMGLKVVSTGLDGRFRADVESIKENINPKTLAVVATAGTASLGAVDPIEEINSLCGDVFLHVDAAFGGFILPFLGTRRIDFSLDNVDSMTIDPHKMGCCPMPAGSILFRDASYIEKLTVTPAYLPISTYALSGSRPGGAIAATWATLRYLGLDGYRKIVEKCICNTRFLCDRIRRIEGAAIVTEPDLNVVGIKLANLEENAAALEKRGWRIAVNRDISCIRFVVMPHVTREVIAEFAEDLKEILEEKKRDRKK